jgi:hypothetical protein
MRKLTCPATSITIGQNLRAFTDNLEGIHTRPVMAKYGMVDLDPEKWYPTHLLLDALNDLSEMPGLTQNLVAIGMMIGEIIPMPPGYENPTLEQVYMLWDKLYQDLHRDGDVGGIRCEKVREKHVKIYHSVVYPDDLSYGLQYSYARRFLPPTTPFKVFYDPDFLPRDYGGQGEATIIHTRWE